MTRIRKALTVTALSAAIVAAPGVASAHGTPDSTSTPYCGPGMTWNDVSAKCVSTHQHSIEPKAGPGDYAVAILGIIGLLALL